MSTHLPGFQSFYGFLHHFVLAKLATSSIRVNSRQVYIPYASVLIYAFIGDITTIAWHFFVSTGMTWCRFCQKIRAENPAHHQA